MAFANDLGDIFGLITLFGGKQHDLGASAIARLRGLLVKFFQLGKLFFCQGWHLDAFHATIIPIKIYVTVLSPL